MCLKRILIVSDIHIGKEEDLNSVTKLTVATPELPSSRNPMESLKDFLITANTKIDAIINLGDVTDKGYAAGWFTGIKMLREISLILKCPLLSTPGNHDYMLNDEEKFDDRLLKGVKDYPTDNETANGKFWADGFCIYEHENMQFLICNSERHLRCKADLDTSPIFDDEYISRIKEELSKKTFNGVKIAILHHHVVAHSDLLNPQKSDVIDNGDKFMAMLRELKYYCVIHGHKHQPRITNLNGVHIVASGSLASTQNTSQARIDNHFHLMVLEIDEQIKGYLESYKFVPGEGWNPISDYDYPIKPVHGFGYSLNVEKLVDEIIAYYFEGENKFSYVNIKTISQKFPEINALSEEQMQDFLNVCRTKGYNPFKESLVSLIMNKQNR